MGRPPECGFLATLSKKKILVCLQGTGFFVRLTGMCVFCVGLPSKIEYGPCGRKNKFQNVFGRQHDSAQFGVSIVSDSFH